jgi:hypothetical protein
MPFGLQVAYVATAAKVIWLLVTGLALSSVGFSGPGLCVALLAYFWVVQVGDDDDAPAAPPISRPPQRH